ncbi:MAG TPA: TonB-dependent receptor plug domain-containing protein, partial [Flavisolibacter sp.]|nr:TonB-dependent receptor plug domain-containing protein [Flavisolibacter sp.]
MKKILSFAVILLLPFFVAAQHSFRAVVRDSASGEVLAGVTVVAGKTGETHLTNDSGRVQFGNLPGGENGFTLTYSGTTAKEVVFVLPDTAVHLIYMVREAASLEQVVISTTRTEARMESSPLKVEVLGREEMDEENTIKPGNIASILGDVSGVQIQQSSPVSGNANVRIQGLEGRYTQILRDGMPLFEGFSGGFGILTIPPLDLRQIELVKGSASTLYGGGAIGGLVNLISKRPTAKQEAVLTLNQTTLKESNINTYLAKRSNGFGYTFFGGFTRQGATDVNGDGLTDVSKQNTYIVHPRLFFYPSTKTTIIAGYTGTFSTNTGGDILVLKGLKNTQHQFFETNDTKRHTGEFILEQNFPKGLKGAIKSSISQFDRRLETASHFFRGRQRNYYTEATLFIPRNHWNLVAGANVTGDAFEKKPSDPVRLQNVSSNTLGAFA